MNFFIRKLKLWFKTHKQPISYEFKPDKVNVITGNSSTGKSSILRIIDYCLFSPESSIVEDVINQNVEWYGLIFHLNGHDYAVARKAPHNATISRDIYWKEDSIDFSDEYPTPTPDVSRISLEEWMNQNFYIDGMKVADKKSVYALTFRHMMMLSYLTEDIIATLNTYFDTNFFGDRDFFKYLPNIVQVGIGLDSHSIDNLKNEIKDISKKINSEEKKKCKDNENEKRYNRNLSEIVEKARSIGVVKDSVEVDNYEEVVGKAIREFIEEFGRIKRNKSKLKEIDYLETQLQEVQSEIRILNSMKMEYNRSRAYAQAIKDSVSPMEFLIKHIDAHVMSKETVLLYQSLERAFLNTRNVDYEIEELPSKFQENFEALRKKEIEIKNKLKELEVISSLTADSSKLMVAFRIEYMLRELKKKTATYCGDVKLGLLKDKLEVVKQQLIDLTAKNEIVLKELNQNIQVYYDMQDGISDSYSNCEVSFDLDNALLKIRKRGEYAYIKNVGSKSNYMFLHLCFFLGLHEYISSSKNVRVPNFLFIDQPSIPYFGHGKKTEEKYMRVSSKDDEAKLKAAFNLINEFMQQNISSDEHFQIIMVEHADPEYWKNLPFFETRYVFTEDRDYGLIPKYVAE